MFRKKSADQYSATINVENLAGDEAGVFGAQEEHGRGDLFRRGGAAQRDGGINFFADDGIVERRRGHVGGDPAGGDAVDANAMGSELSGESFDHADERALAGGIVAVERFAALPGGGADEHNVAGGVSRFALLFFALRLHFGDGGLVE